MLPLLPVFALAATTAAAPKAPAVPSDALSRDTRGRPVIQARIDDRGPYPMIVDTAAQTSLIVARVATELGISPADETVDVSGATGGAQASLYRVRRFATGLFDQRDVALVGLPNASTTDARGIIGMDLFRGRRLLFDRAAARLSVGPSAPAPAGFVAHKGRVDENGFVEVPVSLDGVAIPALVDTGAAVTIVNAAAFSRLGWAATDPRLNAGGEIFGAAAAGRSVRIATVSRVTIGPVTLSNVPLIVTPGDDSEPPSIILGDDLLNLLDAYAVDFGSGELQIRLPQRVRGTGDPPAGSITGARH